MVWVREARVDCKQSACGPRRAPDMLGRSDALGNLRRLVSSAGLRDVCSGRHTVAEKRKLGQDCNRNNDRTDQVKLLLVAVLVLRDLGCASSSARSCSGTQPDLPLGSTQR